MRFLKRTPLIWMLSALLSLAWHTRAFGLQKIIYSDRGILEGAMVYTWDSFRGWGIGTGEATFNGNYKDGIPFDSNICFQTINDHANTYAGWGVFKNENMSAYAGGYLKFWVKTDVDLKVDIKDTFNHTKYISQYGWSTGDAGNWKEISIPINDFGASLSNITGLFLITVENVNRTFFVDYARWTDFDVPTLNEIKVFPKQSALEVGDQKELIAVGYDTDGDPMMINPGWSVVSGNGAIVSTSGNRAVFQGNGVAPATVEAAVGAIAGSADINVTTADRIVSLSYNIYSDVGLPPGTTSIPQMPGGVTNGPTCSEIGTSANPSPDAQEGGKYYQTVIGTATWGGWWIELPNEDDLMDYESGILKFHARSSADLVIKLKGSSIESKEKILTSFGWQPNNTWQEVEIPLAEFAIDGVDFLSLKIVFLISTFGAPGQGTVFDIDHVRYKTLYALPNPPHIIISGRQLLIDNVAFTVRGVCYSPTPVGEGYTDFDVSEHPEIYERDFRLLKAMGVNTIRIYKPPTQIEFLDTAFNQGLYVIMDYPVPHDADLPNATVRENIKTGFINMVNTWKNHPAVLMWSLGNEINVHLNGLTHSEWYAFVNTCAYEAHQAEGVEYHPVISANAGVTEIGEEFFGATDDFLLHLDAWAVQVYKGSSFGNLFTNLKSRTNKPLLLTEFGCDAFDMRNAKEEQGEQASYIGNQVTEIENNASEVNPSDICIGGTVFAWSDDWSKAQWGWPDSVHETVGLYSNPAYYDYESISINNMNEEWWGICAVSSGTTDRTLREAYFTLQSLWRQNPLMNVHINGGGNQLAWSNATAGENVWGVADYPITIEANDAYGDNFDVWGIQIYTDNKSSDANPQYSGDTSKNFNLVNEADTNKGLALCWKVTDTVGNPGVPVWVSDRGDLEHTEGFTDYAWRWMKDRGQTNHPFVPNEEYVRVWDQNGIYWADHVGLDVDPSTSGDQPCPAAAYSPNYIYIGVRLHDSLAQAYSTNKLMLEFIFP